MIFKFIKLIPSFFRLFREYEMKPEDIRFSLENYRIVIYGLTNGRMSKLNYYASDIISEVNNRFCEDCCMLDSQKP